MGAVEPEAEKPREKTYRVSGSNAVFGVEPGKTFKRAIPLNQEARLLASGAISESAAKSADTKKAEQEPAATDKE